MLSDVIQTAKYGTATKENVLQILSQNEILLYTSNASFQIALCGVS